MKIFEKLLEQLTKEESRQILRIQTELEDKLAEIQCDGEYSIRIKLPNLIILSDPKGYTTDFIINNFKDEVGFTTDSNFLNNIGKSILSLDEIVKYCMYDTIVQLFKDCGAEGNDIDFYEFNSSAKIDDMTYVSLIKRLKAENWNNVFTSRNKSVQRWCHPGFSELIITISRKEVSRYNIEDFFIYIENFD